MQQGLYLELMGSCEKVTALELFDADQFMAQGLWTHVEKIHKAHQLQQRVFHALPLAMALTA